MKRALGSGYGFLDLGCAYPSVVLVLVCSLPDVGMRIRLMGMVSLVSPWSWCSCVLCQTLVCGFGLWAWIALSLRGPGARVFSAMEIPQLQYFLGGRCPCSVLSRSDCGDSTGIVLRSVDDVPVVVQRQVQGQTVQQRAGTAVTFEVFFRRGAEAGSMVHTVV